MMKFNRLGQFIESNKQLSFLIVSVLMFTLSFGVSLFSGSSSSGEIEALSSELSTLNNQLALRRTTEVEDVNRVVYEQTGVHPDTIRSDRELATAFFEPAFSWTSGEAYDEARTTYIDALGENSSFIETYITENRKVEGYNYIDLYELGVDFEGMDVYALDEQDGVISYMGVARYYMYRDDSDLINRGALTGSQAIVRFNVFSDDASKPLAEQSRYIRDVVAYPGFSSLINEN